MIVSAGRLQGQSAKIYPPLMPRVTETYLTSDVLSFLFIFFILVVLFMLFVDLPKMLLQSVRSFLVQSKEDKCDYGHTHIQFVLYLGGEVL